MPRGSADDHSDNDAPSRTFEHDSAARTVRIRTANRRPNTRLLVLACVGGLLLIAAPPVAFSLFGPNRPLLTDTPSTATRSLVPDRPVPPRKPASSANRDATGRLVVLGRALDGSVQRNYQGKPAKGSVGWHSLGGNIQGKPVLVVGPGTDYEMSAFAIDPQGKLRQHPSVSAMRTASENWKDLGGRNLVGTPAVALDSNDRFVVVARATDGKLWVRYQTGERERDWSHWHPLPGPPVLGDPVIHRDGQNRLRVFALGSDHVIRTLTQEEPGIDEWSPGEIPGAVANASPAVTTDGRDRLHVFTIDPEGTLRTTVETEPASGTWRDWDSHPGPPLTGKPIASNDANNTVVAFAIHRDTRHLMHLYEDPERSGPDSTEWGEWEDLGGSLTELLSTVNDANGHLVVFGIGTNGTMAQNYQENRASGPWHGWDHSFGGGSFPQQSDSP